jgi:hypothetical protein
MFEETYKGNVEQSAPADGLLPPLSRNVMAHERTLNSDDLVARLHGRPARPRRFVPERPCYITVGTGERSVKARVLDISDAGAALLLTEENVDYLRPDGPTLYAGSEIQVLSRDQQAQCRVIRVWSPPHYQRGSQGIALLFDRVDAGFLRDIVLLEEHDPIQDAHRQTIQQVLVACAEEVTKYAVKHPEILFEVSSRKFEEIIAEIWSTFGFKVELTSPTKDGGYDILAMSTNLAGIPSKYIIECKRYKSGHKVGVHVVRALYCVQTLVEADRAIVATTSSFTNGAWKLSKKGALWTVELKDFDALLGWLGTYREIKGLGP